MEKSNSETVTVHSEVAELASALSKTKHDLSVAQKINKRVLGELKTWKERALNLESNLKQEKRSNEKNITQLGFKMLQFENHLRKEQRDIESKFIDKENQIKALEDVISSLHSRIKKNSLCYNCFVVRHNSPERCASPDSYATKFPLDMDFSDHKPGNHGVLDARGRSVSLPLNLQSPIESPKANTELCFHHMLSPVPEELEISISEHAKRSFKEPEECDTLDEESELQEGAKQTEEDNQENIELYAHASESQEDGNRTIETERNNGNQKAQLVTEMQIGTADAEIESEQMDTAESRINVDKCEGNMFGTDENLTESFNAKGTEVDVKDEKRIDDSVLPSNSKTIDDEQYASKISECQEAFCEDGHILNSEVHSVLSDIISRVETLMEHRHNACADSVNTNIKHTENCPDDTLAGMSQDRLQNTMEVVDREGGNRMPLSPKSEAIVAELKRAIFDASIELEKRHEVVSQAAPSNLEKTVENDVINSRKSSSQLDEITEGGRSRTIKQNENGSNVRLSSTTISEISSEQNGDLSITKEGEALLGECVETVDPELGTVNNSVTEQCEDTLTEYDVIELD